MATLPAPAMRVAAAEGGRRPSIDSMDVVQLAEAIMKARGWIMQDDHDKQLDGIQYLRRLLTKDRGVGSSLVAEAGVVPRLVYLLQLDQNPELQHEAAWMVQCIVSGTSANVALVVMSGAVPALIRLLKNESDGIVTEVAMALSSIAKDSVAFRDSVLQLGGLTALVHAIEESVCDHAVCLLARAVADLSKGAPLPPFGKLRPALAVLPDLLTEEDTATVAEAAWALVHMAQASEGALALTERGVWPKLKALLREQSAPEVLLPVLKLVRLLAPALEMSLSDLLELLAHDDGRVRAATCSALTIASPTLFDAMLEGDILAGLVELIGQDEEAVEVEAALALATITQQVSQENVCLLVDLGALEAISKALRVPDERLVEAVVKALLIMVQAIQSRDHVRAFQALEGTNFLYVIKVFRQHDNASIAAAAKKIVVVYRSMKEVL